MDTEKLFNPFNHDSWRQKLIKYLLIFVVLFYGCENAHINLSEETTMKTTIEEINKRSGLNLDKASEVLNQEDNLGGHQESQAWLISSKDAVNLPKGEFGLKEDSDAAEYLSRYKKNHPRQEFGKLVSEKSVSSSWDRKDSAWSGTIIQTEKGYFLELQWVKQVN